MEVEEGGLSFLVEELSSSGWGESCNFVESRSPSRRRVLRTLPWASSRDIYHDEVEAEVEEW